MSDHALMQQFRRRKDETARILDNESFNVGAARGKLARVCDFFCTDKLGYKIVKVCLDSISRDELDRLLAFSDSAHEGTIIQIFFWRRGDHAPFYKPKLRYNSPKQVIPAELQKLVK